jgi:Kdo2-lipid IVA lauroyltransferase/acyltransferase
MFKNWISYLAFRSVLLVFRFIPFRVIYWMSDGMRPLLQHVFKYRRNVVRTQLRECFPDWSDAQLMATETAFYSNISDVLLEAIKGLGTPAHQILRRMHYPNPDVISDHLRAGRSVIMTGSHHCNWEWAALTVAQHIDGEVVGVYKKLSNPLVERYVRVTRARLGMTLKEMKETMQTLAERKNKAAAYVLMADQWPSNVTRAHWVTWMGRETACLPGVDFISRAHQMAVVYYEVTRQGRGRYTLTFSELIVADAQTPEEAVTQITQKRIEAQVKADPANWLWSHKRWKHGRGQ